MNVMDVVFSVCIVRHGAGCSCMGSVGVSSCRYCMFVHPMAVLNVGF